MADKPADHGNDETQRIPADESIPAPEPAPEPQPEPAPAYAATPPHAAERAPAKRKRSIGLPVAAAVAAALVVVSGLAGFALGATVGGDDLDRVSFQRGGFPGGPGAPGFGDGDGRGWGPGRGLGFPGMPPGTDDGTAPEDTQPDDGTAEDSADVT